jgi:pyridoxamine 5'-phosphate oxidase
MANNLYLDALERLNGLITEGWRRDLREANTAALATADTNARPSVRIVNILSIEERGLSFVANTKSGKSRQLRVNPWASLCFYWPELEEQVIVEGAVLQEDEEVSDIYWNKVPREKQIYTRVDKEKLPSESPGALREKVTEDWPLSGFAPIERPADWRAFTLAPERIEFWPFGWRRAQERIHYSRTNDGEWYKELLSI